MHLPDWSESQAMIKTFNFAPFILKASGFCGQRQRLQPSLISLSQTIPLTGESPLFQIRLKSVELGFPNSIICYKLKEVKSLALKMFMRCKFKVKINT